MASHAAMTAERIASIAVVMALFIASHAETTTSLMARKHRRHCGFIASHTVVMTF